MEQEQEHTQEVGGWGDYLSNFLSTDDVKFREDSDLSDQEFLVLEVYNAVSNSENRIRLELQAEDNRFLFELNKTNAVFLKEEAGLKHPKQVKGCKLKFRKTMARNPNLNKEVPSLRIREVICPQ